MRRFLVLLLLAPTAMACTEADPCLLRVHTDSDGVYFATPSQTETAVDQGDWYRFDVWNGHSTAHDLFLEHYGVRIEAAPFGQGGASSTRSGPVHFTDDGSFILRDQDSGDEATIVVRPDASFSHNMSKPATTSTTTQTSAPTFTQNDEPEPERVRNVPVPLVATVAAILVASRLRP